LTILSLDSVIAQQITGLLLWLSAIRSDHILFFSFRFRSQVSDDAIALSSSTTKPTHCASATPSKECHSTNTNTNTPSNHHRRGWLT